MTEKKKNKTLKITGIIIFAAWLGILIAWVAYYINVHNIPSASAVIYAENPDQFSLLINNTDHVKIIGSNSEFQVYKVSYFDPDASPESNPVRPLQKDLNQISSKAEIIILKKPAYEKIVTGTDNALSIFMDTLFCGMTFFMADLVISEIIPTKDEKE